MARKCENADLIGVLVSFHRETINPLADAADAAERYMGFAQIDLIKQILLFSSAVSAISARNYQSSRRLRRLHITGK